jgi:hypothetical protein
MRAKKKKAVRAQDINRGVMTTLPKLLRLQVNSRGDTEIPAKRAAARLPAQLQRKTPTPQAAASYQFQKSRAMHAPRFGGECP